MSRWIYTPSLIVGMICSFTIYSTQLRTSAAQLHFKPILIDRSTMGRPSGVKLQRRLLQQFLSLLLFCSTPDLTCQTNWVYSTDQRRYVLELMVYTVIVIELSEANSLPRFEIKNVGRTSETELILGCIVPIKSVAHIFRSHGYISGS